MSAPADVRGLIHGRWKADVVRAILFHRIPDRLATGPRTVDELAAGAALDPGRLDSLMALAVSIGLFAATGPRRYRNNAASDLLRADHPASMVIDAKHALSDWGAIAWDNLGTAIASGSSGFRAATGVGVFDHLAEYSDQAADFDAFQALVTRRNAALLARAWQPPHGVTIVDIGGGTGELLASLLKDRPDLRGIVADRPEAVRQVARRAQHDPDLGARLTGVPTDFFESVPGGGDIYVLSHVLHDWDDAAAARILSTTARHLRENASLLVLENVDDSQDALLVAYLDLLMLTAWGSRERSIMAYARLLHRAGLRLSGHALLDPRSRLTLLTAHVK